MKATDPLVNNHSESMTTDLTEGNVSSVLFKFAMPLFVSNALQALYNLVDMVVVGRVLGETGMSAVSTGGDILHLLTFVAMGFSSAGQVLIARDVGAKKEDSVRKTIGTMFTVLLIASLAISVVCFGIRENLLNWLNTPIRARAYTMDYMVTCICGLVFIYGYNVVSAILRGMGDSKRPFVFVAIAAVLNTILDIVFVSWCHMEVFGAALATVIGQGASFLISIVYLYIKRDSFGFDFKLKSFKPDKTALKSLTVLGIPMAIQSAAVNFSKIIITAWVNKFDVTYSALSGIYNKVGMMAAVVSNSFTTAGSSMVSQCLGAEKTDRVPKIMKSIFWVNIILTVVFSLLVMLFPNQTFSLFTNDVSVLTLASLIVGPTVVNFFGSATRSVAFALINGSGNTKLNLAVALIDGLISRISIAALLGYAAGLDCLGFWYGDALAGFIPITIGMIFFFSGKWKKLSRELQPTPISK